MANVRYGWLTSTWPTNNSSQFRWYNINSSYDKIMDYLIPFATESRYFRFHWLIRPHVLLVVVQSLLFSQYVGVTGQEDV